MFHPLATPSEIEIIRRGGLVIFPTETLYGLGCVATNEDALRRLFEAKGRPPGQPPPVLVASDEQLSTLVAAIPPVAARLIAAHWPGPLTLVLPARAEVSPLLTGLAVDGQTRTVGVRHSAHPVAQSLCQAAGAPIVATSANRSGAVGAAANPRVLDDIPDLLRQHVEVIIDGGEVAGEPSTVVDCTCQPPRILRQGALRLEF
jgi:L-threonylcarbamoyladenylate synthase